MKRVRNLDYSNSNLLPLSITRAKPCWPPLKNSQSETLINKSIFQGSLSKITKEIELKGKLICGRIDMNGARKEIKETQEKEERKDTSLMTEICNEFALQIVEGKD